jgi:hypothetical protein
MLKIATIIGTARQNWKNETVARWVYHNSQGRDAEGSITPSAYPPTGR